LALYPSLTAHLLQPHYSISLEKLEQIALHSSKSSRAATQLLYALH